jgi:signal transduction histidine kinase
MDDGEEARRLRALVREAAHELSNSLGIALNYTDFLAEDIGATDHTHPVWETLTPIQEALRRSAATVQRLRERALSAEQQVGADGAQHGQDDRGQDHP